MIGCTSFGTVTFACSPAHGRMRIASRNVMPAVASATSGAPSDRNASATTTKISAMLAASMIGSECSISSNCARRAGPAPVTPTTEPPRAPPSCVVAYVCAVCVVDSSESSGGKYRYVTAVVPRSLAGTPRAAFEIGIAARMSRRVGSLRPKTVRAPWTARRWAAAESPRGLRWTTAVCAESGKPKRFVASAAALLAAPFLAARSSSGAVGAEARSGSEIVATTTAAIHASGIRWRRAMTVAA